MPAVVSRALSLLGIWGVAFGLLHWSRLPGHARRAVALFVGTIALVFLIVGINTEGLRESPATAVFLMGTAYVTEQASASASLPYYVMTGVCLLLGTAALAVTDDLARRLADRWLASAIALSLAVTALRFCLEKMAAPPSWAAAVGIVWLAPMVGAFFALRLREEGQGLGSLLRALLLYALASRGAVAALVVVSSTLRLGSHYDVSSLTKVWNPFTGHPYAFAASSFDQILYVGILPQLLFWPLYTVLAGLLGASVALTVTALWSRPRSGEARAAALVPVGEEPKPPAAEAL